MVFSFGQNRFLIPLNCPLNEILLCGAFLMHTSRFRKVIMAFISQHRRIFSQTFRKKVRPFRIGPNQLMREPLVTNFMHGHIAGEIHILWVFCITRILDKTDIFRERHSARKSLRKARKWKFHNPQLRILIRAKVVRERIHGCLHRGKHNVDIEVMFRMEINFQGHIFAIGVFPDIRPQLILRSQEREEIQNRINGTIFATATTVFNCFAAELTWSDWNLTLDRAHPRIKIDIICITRKGG